MVAFSWHRENYKFKVQYLKGLYIMDIAEAEKLIEELEAKTANLKEMVADYGKVSN